nr:hypothetical protein [Ktedonobacterales bacterium]
VETMMTHHPRPDALDLAAAISGLVEAARWALAGDLAVYREIHQAQYPLGPALGKMPPQVDALWQDIATVEGLPPAPVGGLKQEQVVAGALWLAARIQSITTRCQERLATGPTRAHGVTLASPPQVVAVVRELALIAGFTIWFGGLLQQRAAEIVAGRPMVAGVRSGQPWLMPTAENGNALPSGEEHDGEERGVARESEPARR